MFSRKHILYHDYKFKATVSCPYALFWLLGQRGGDGLDKSTRLLKIVLDLSNVYFFILCVFLSWMFFFILHACLSVDCFYSFYLFLDIAPVCYNIFFVIRVFLFCRGRRRWSPLLLWAVGRLLPGSCPCGLYFIHLIHFNTFLTLRF